MMPKRVVGGLWRGKSLRMERLLDARPRGWDIDHLVWDFHVEHGRTGVIRVLHEWVGVRGALFWQRGGVLGA